LFLALTFATMVCQLLIKRLESLYSVNLAEICGSSDIKAAATWEVDGTGATTGVPFSMYLLSGRILNQFDFSFSSICYFFNPHHTLFAS